MNKGFLGADDLVNNPTTRIPVVLCLDVSGSMYGSPISELSEGVNIFYEAIKEDEIAKYSAEIAIVTFESYVNVVEDFSTVDQKKHVNFTANGGTNMRDGVEKALELLENRKQAYTKAGVDYFQPWLVLMSDGEAYDVSDVQQRTKNLEATKKLTVFPIGIGSAASLDTLSGFSNKRKAIRLKDHKFRELFEFLSKSVAAVSKSQLGETVKVDINDVKEWGEI